MIPETATDGPKATRRDWIGLAVLALPCILYSMDLTVLHLAVPEITRVLQPSSAQLLWIVDIYGFMVAGSLITMGTLGDRIGRRRLLLIGAAAFGATSLLAAFSTSAHMLITARALQGVAAATLAPSTLSLITNMFRNSRQRTVAIGVWIASFSAGAAIGPLIGGLILAHYWWGAVFLINVPIMLLLLALGPILLPEFRDPSAGRMDLRSAAQSIISVLAIIYGIKRIAEDGWAPNRGMFIAIGLIVGTLFLWRQMRLADPLIDVRLFRAPALSAALAANIIGLFAIFGTFLFIAQYLQLVLGMGPLEAGIWTAPSGVVFAFGSMAAPPLLRRFSPATVIARGFLLAAVGFSMLTLLGRFESPWLLLAGMLVFCLGLAPVGTITTDLVMAEAPPERAGAASGVSETSFEFGGALGIAVLGSVMTAIYRGMMAGEALPGVPPHAIEVAKDTLGGALAVGGQLPVDSGAKLVETARAAFVYAFAVTSAISAAVSIVAAALTGVLLRGAGKHRE